MEREHHRRFVPVTPGTGSERRRSGTRRTLWILALSLGALAPAAFGTDANDFLGWYDRFGQHGKWDGTVREAVRLHCRSMEDETRAAELFAHAWEQGCRDAMVAFFRVRQINLVGPVKDADALWQTILKEVPGTYEEGVYRYGYIPLNMTLILLRQGKADQARKLVEQHRQAALDAGFPLAAGIVSSGMLYVESFRSPDTARAYWAAHASELRPAQERLDWWPFDVMMRNQEVLDDLTPVLEFLRAQPECAAVRKWREYYEGQSAARLAATTQPTSNAQHPVLVDWCAEMRGIESPLSRYEMAYFEHPGLPLGISCQVRITREPLSRSRYLSYAKIFAGRHATVGQMHVLLSTRGEVTTRNTGDANRELDRPSAFVDPLQWHEMRIEQRPGCSLAWLDGRCIRKVVRPGGEEGTTSLRLQVCGTTADFRDIRLYAYATEPVDNNELLALHRAVHDARLAGDVERAREAHERRMRILAPIPAAGPWLQYIQLQQSLFEAVASEEGLDLPASGALWKAIRRTSCWRGDVDWMETGCNHRYKDHYRTLLLPLSLPRDFEITGVLRVDANAEKGDVVPTISWHAATTHDLKNCCKFDFRNDLVTLYGLEGRKQASVSLGREMGPIAFGIRVRGESAAMFVHDPREPLLTLSPMRPNGNQFILTVYDLPRGGRMGFGHLRIRRLPPDTLLHAPMDLPQLPGMRPPESDDGPDNSSE